jgi:FAD/FMN-containing dehydrogenase
MELSGALLSINSGTGPFSGASPPTVPEPGDAEDAVPAVESARDDDLRVAVRNVGQNFAGQSICDGNRQRLFCHKGVCGPIWTSRPCSKAGLIGQLDQ